MDTKEIQNLFVQYGVRREKKKNQYLYDPTLSGAAEHSEAYFLDQGIGALTSINSDGEEKIFLYFGEKRIIGFSGILAHKYQYIHAKSLIAPPAPFWIIAKTNCVYYVMGEPDFSRLIDENPHFMGAVLESTFLNYLEIINKIQHTQDVDKETMFCEWLLTCRIRRDGRCIIPKAFTFTEAAKYLDMHPVTVSRIAANLRNQGIISRVDGYLTINDEKRLYDLIQERKSPSSLPF